MSNGALVAELQDADLLQCAICSSTLQDAVLLTCLHSVCRSCAGDATVSVICPVCGVVTDTSTKKANLIVSTLVHRLQIMKSMFSCTHCAAESEQHTSSVAWCYTCQQSLCIDCENHHKRYNSNHTVKHLDEHTVLSELYRAPSRMCTKHGDELKLVCFTCRDGRCFKCAHDCYTASHDVQLIDSPAAVDRLKDRITDATRVISDLSSTDLLLQAHLSLPEKLACALEESRAVLRNAKKKAIDSIGNAYDNAEHSLIECWEVIASKADALCESADSLKKRLDWAKKYCKVALSTKDMTLLLPQLDALSSCLCSLLDEVSKVEQPADPRKLISMNVCLPHDLDLITSDWLGTATVVSDKFIHDKVDCSVDDIPREVQKDYYARRVSALNELEELIRKNEGQQEYFERERLAAEQQLDAMKNDIRKLIDKQKEQQEQLERVRRTVGQLQSEVESKTLQLAAPTRPLSFHNNEGGTFKGPGRCWDVAITPQGSLLVAATADGLKEYDATSFQEIATWRPSSDLLGQQISVFVRTVDVLSDGRAVVGIYPKLVLLLRRDVVCGSGSGSSEAETWRVERRVAELQAPPRHLCAWGDRLLAVLEDRNDGNTKSWCSGPGLVMLSLYDDEDGDKRRRLNTRQRLDYNADRVALTDRGVMVASSDLVELTDAVGSGGGSRKCFVVDCYSHLGVRLWRHEMAATSLCSDSVGRVLYAAKSGSVVALSVDDGRELSTAITLSTKETERTYALALDRATQRLTALISFDGDKPNIVTIFTVA